MFTQSKLLLNMLPALSLTMLMLFCTVVEVARVRNSRNMVEWSLLMAAFSRVSAFSFQYVFWSRCNPTLRRRDRVLYSGIFPASLAFRHSSIMMWDSCDIHGFLGHLRDFVQLMAASVTSSLNCSHISRRLGSLAKAWSLKGRPVMGLAFWTFCITRSLREGRVRSRVR